MIHIHDLDENKKNWKNKKNKDKMFDIMRAHSVNSDVCMFVNVNFIDLNFKPSTIPFKY